ncbi:hypothetical protein N0V94_003833 [Neodidymelliopsis sp. IMI 364377]|nr:hypothetical protein N0V94_003833 [Neodidymelliopsis sp. IMI 364377]
MSSTTNDDEDMADDISVSSDGVVAPPPPPPNKERRVHIHVQDHVINIHEYLLYEQSATWSTDLIKLFEDEKGEAHFKDESSDAWLNHVMTFWLYKKEFPDLVQLGTWNKDIPKDWSEGAGKNPLAASLVIELATFAWERDFYPLYNEMVDFLFGTCQSQRIALDSRRVQRIHSSNKTDLHYVAIDLQVKYGGSDWDAHVDDDDDEEISKWPSRFLFGLIEQFSRMRDQKVDAFNGVALSKEPDKVQLYDPDGSIALDRCAHHYGCHCSKPEDNLSGDRRELWIPGG